MAKRPEGVPFIVGGVAMREQIWQILEGQYNLGVTEFRIIAPPRPEPAPTNGTALLPAPQQRHSKSTTARDAIERLANRGEPFSFADALAAMRRAGKLGGPGNNLMSMVEGGTLKRLGAGQYILAKAEQAGDAKPVAKHRTIVDIVNEALKAAYPQPMTLPALREHVSSKGRRAASASVSLNWLRKRKAAKNVKLGEWIHVPTKTKGAKK